MADSPYEVRPGGSLKLKRTRDEDGSESKKKKKKSKAKGDKDRVREDLSKEQGSAQPGSGGESEGSGRNSPAATAGGSKGGSDNKTDAEKRFEDVQRKRLEKRIAKLATKTHKDRVHEFNSKLEALSEHHDIPKVGPG